MSIDPAFKRAQFLKLKELNDNGRLIPPKRKKLPRKLRLEVLARQEGLCARCEEKIFGKFEVDHMLERDLMGTDDVRNLVALHPECHRPKTSARATVIAKVHRLDRNTFEGKPESKRPLKSRPTEWPKQKLQSRNSFRRARA